MRLKRTRLYVAAFAITTIIFILGILLGMVVEERRLSYVENKYQQDKINYESLQLQYLYLATLTEGEGCEAFSTTLNGYLKKLEETRIRLESYAQDGNVFPNEFTELRRQYFIAELNYWLLAKKTRETCNSDTITVLYFYTPQCSECENQGYVLDYLKRVFGDRLLIFALDESFKEEEMIPILKNTFNITSAPTMIVENHKFEGFVPEDRLNEFICKKYESPPEGC